jgi:hypothetical protein
MYGRSQSFVASYILDAAYEAGKKGETFETFINPETRWQTCHQDDVGDLFARVGVRVSATSLEADCAVDDGGYAYGLFWKETA